MYRIFLDKGKYVVHQENLQIYLKLGLKLKYKLLLQFDQSQWLKQYIKFNTRKRIEAENNKELPINEQCCIWRNNGKLEKQNRCKTSKQRKRLFKMHLKKKLYVAPNI